jgi:hypothetical protein
MDVYDDHYLGKDGEFVWSIPSMEFLGESARVADAEVVQEWVAQIIMPLSGRMISEEV